MSFYPSIPGNRNLLALWQRFPKGVAELLAHHDIFLRGNSALTIGERELIAAHVSALNRCHYCYAAHRRYALAFGIPEAALGDMAVDTAHPGLRPAIGAALAYAEKLTLDPGGVAQADFDTLLAAGWSEEAINDIVTVIALYNFMNRLLDGSGFKQNVAPAGFSPEKALAGRYTDMLKLLG